MSLFRSVRPLVLGAALVGAAFTSLAPSVSEAQVIIVEPPAPQEEVVPVAPYEGAYWTPGYYAWRGRRHVWVGGSYVRARPGYRWEAHRWAHEGRGWRMHRGHWVR